MKTINWSDLGFNFIISLLILAIITVFIGGIMDIGEYAHKYEDVLAKYEDVVARLDAIESNPFAHKHKYFFISESIEK